MATIPVAESTADKVVGDILNFQATSAEDIAASKGSYFSAQGDQSEQQAYLTAKQLAEQNAALETVSGQIQNTQQERAVRQTLGSQSAAVASAGFGASGTALDLLRSSRQQGYLQEQLTGVQSQITATGYSGQAAAAAAEAAAAGTASDAATALAQQQAASGSLLSSYAAAETDALKQVTGGSTAGTPGTPATNVFNGLTWVRTPATPGTPGTSVSNAIAGIAGNGGTLSPAALGSLAVQQGGGTNAAAPAPAPIRTFNGVSWSS